MPALLLVRHAQASFGKEDYDALSPIGHEQAQVLGESLRRRLPRLDAVVTGTLVRQKDTARLCLAAMGAGAPIETHPGLDELDHLDVLGCYEPRYADPSALAADLHASGDPHRTFQEVFSAAMARWLGGRHDAEYGEPFPAFRARCLAAVEVIAEGLHPAATALVVTSAGPIAVAAQHVSGLPHDRYLGTLFTLLNASVSKLVAGPSGLRLSSFNEHAHLEGNGTRLLTYR